MTKRKYTILVRGRRETWSFHIQEDPKYLGMWLADGLQIDPLENTIPQWVDTLGLTGLWMKLQDWSK